MLILDLLIVAVFWLMWKICMFVKSVPEYLVQYWHELICEIAIAVAVNCMGVLVTLLVCSKYPWEFCPVVATVGLFTAGCCGLVFANPASKQWKDAPKEIIIIGMLSYVPFVGQMLFATIF